MIVFCCPCQVYSRCFSLPNTQCVQYSVFQQCPPSYRPVATPQGKVHSLNNVGWTLNSTLLSTGQNIHSTTPYNVHTLHTTIFSNVHTLHSTLHCIIHTLYSTLLSTPNKRAVATNAESLH